MNVDLAKGPRTQKARIALAVPKLPEGALQRHLRGECFLTIKNPELRWRKTDQGIVSHLLAVELGLAYLLDDMLYRHHHLAQRPSDAYVVLRDVPSRRRATHILTESLGDYAGSIPRLFLVFFCSNVLVTTCFLLRISITIVTKLGSN